MSNPLATIDRLNAALDDVEPDALDAWADLYGSEFVEHLEDHAGELQKSSYNRAAKIEDE